MRERRRQPVKATRSIDMRAEMTSQTKHFIELSDLVALRFQCKKEDCGATFTLPLSRALNTKKLAMCPHCERPWLNIAIGEVGERAIWEFAKSLTELARVMNEQSLSFADRVSMVLEIKPDAVTKKEV
jgi:hypothetical protein